MPPPSASYSPCPNISTEAVLQAVHPRYGCPPYYNTSQSQQSRTYVRSPLQAAVEARYQMYIDETYRTARAQIATITESHQQMHRLVQIVPNISPEHFHTAMNRIACETQHNMSRLLRHLSAETRRFNESMLGDAMLLAGERWASMARMHPYGRGEHDCDSFSHTTFSLAGTGHDTHLFKQAGRVGPHGMLETNIANGPRSMAMSRSSSNTTDSSVRTNDLQNDGPLTITRRLSMRDLCEPTTDSMTSTPALHGSPHGQVYSAAADGSETSFHGIKFRLDRHPVPGQPKQRGFGHPVKVVQPFVVEYPTLYGPETLCAQAYSNDRTATTSELSAMRLQTNHRTAHLDAGSLEDVFPFSRAGTPTSDGSGCGPLAVDMTRQRSRSA